jgi:hypothetical protein
LISVHYGPSQIHYSLNTAIQIFPLKKLYDRIILERQLLLNTIFI